jgi:hypothetical protein
VTYLIDFLCRKLIVGGDNLKGFKYSGGDAKDSTFFIKDNKIFLREFFFFYKSSIDKELFLVCEIMV